MDLIKMIVVSPSELFRNSKEKRREIILLFVASFVVVLLKSFFKGRYAATNFFENHILNLIFSFLAIPQVTVFVTYLSFFVFAFVLFLVIRLFSRDASFKPLLFSLMSISGIGIIAHIITVPLIFFAKPFIIPLCYAFYIWVIILTLWSIKSSQNLTLVKAIPSFLIVALPFLLLGWLPVISPYLVFLAA